MTELKCPPHQDDVLTLLRPEDDIAAPLIMDSPHSGRIYPEDFKTKCPQTMLQASEDRFVDFLVRDGILHGATVLMAEFPRTYIDLNRAENDIENEILADPENMPIKRAPTIKADHGIGLIRRLARSNYTMYENALTTNEIMHRIVEYYRPYHTILNGEITRLHDRFGRVLYLDIHSMPNDLAPPVKQNGLMQIINPRRADFVIGDLDGTSCDLKIRDDIIRFIKKAGYTVALNKPFKGWELIKRHGNPSNNINALQIEINRSLYLEKGDRDWKDNCGLELKGFVERLVQHCIDILH